MRGRVLSKLVWANYSGQGDSGITALYVIAQEDDSEPLDPLLTHLHLQHLIKDAFLSYQKSLILSRGYYFDVSFFSTVANFIYSGLKYNWTSPVGPWRCFRIKISAIFFLSESES